MPQVYETTGATPYEVIYGSPQRVYPGGLALDPSELGENSDTVKAGTLVEIDWTNKKAHIVKTAKVYSNFTNSSDTSMQVYKNHEFRVGDYVTDDDGTNEAEITGIDRSNADYDVLEFGSTGSLGGDEAAGNIVEQTDGSNSIKYTPDGVCTISQFVEDQSNSNIGVAVADMATVLKAGLPYPLADGSLSSSNHITTLEPKILFI